MARIVIAGMAMNRGPLSRWSIAGKTHVKVAGEWGYLCRAVDQHGRVIDLLLSVRPDLAEAPPLFSRERGSLMRDAQLTVEFLATSSETPVALRRPLAELLVVTKCESLMT